MAVGGFLEAFHPVLNTGAGIKDGTTSQQSVTSPPAQVAQAPATSADPIVCGKGEIMGGGGWMDVLFVSEVDGDGEGEKENGRGFSSI